MKLEKPGMECLSCKWAGLIDEALIEGPDIENNRMVCPVCGDSVALMNPTECPWCGEKKDKEALLCRDCNLMFSPKKEHILCPPK